MRTFAVLAGLATSVSAQLLTAADLASLPMPQAVTVPVGAGNGTTSSKRNLFRRTETPCGPLALGSGPTPSPDTEQAFLNDTDISSAALGADTPSGWVQTYQNLDAATSTSAYLGFNSYDSYDPDQCAADCLSHSGCLSFNIFFERDPTIQPASACPNPPSTTVIKCSFWGIPIGPETATNTGQYLNNFHVVNAGSNAYVLQNPTYNVNGFNGTSLGTSTINAPTDCNSYITYKSHSGGAYDPNLCAADCLAERNSTDPFGGMTCRFFTSYLLLKNNIVQAQICALYTRTWDSSYATNTGYYSGSDNYTQADVFSYTYSSDIGNFTCPQGGSLAPCTTTSSTTSTTIATTSITTISTSTASTTVSTTASATTVSTTTSTAVQTTTSTTTASTTAVTTTTAQTTAAVTTTVQTTVPTTTSTSTSTAAQTTISSTTVATTAPTTTAITTSSPTTTSTSTAGPTSTSAPGTKSTASSSASASSSSSATTTKCTTSTTSSVPTTLVTSTKCTTSSSTTTKAPNTSLTACPSPLSYVTTFDGGVYAVCGNSDFQISSPQIFWNIQSSKDCAGKCESQSGCTKAVYNPSTQMCYLKGSPSVSQSNWNVNAGFQTLVKVPDGTGINQCLVQTYTVNCKGITYTVCPSSDFSNAPVYNTWRNVQSDSACVALCNAQPGYSNIVYNPFTQTCYNKGNPSYRPSTRWSVNSQCRTLFSS